MQDCCNPVITTSYISHTTQGPVPQIPVQQVRDRTKGPKLPPHETLEVGSYGSHRPEVDSISGIRVYKENIVARLEIIFYLLQDGCIAHTC